MRLIRISPHAAHQAPAQAGVFLLCGYSAVDVGGREEIHAGKAFSAAWSWDRGLRRRCCVLATVPLWRPLFGNIQRNLALLAWDAGFQSDVVALVATPHFAALRPNHKAGNARNGWCGLRRNASAPPLSPVL